MSKAIDITGQRFYRLTAIKPTDERSGSHIKWLFRCDCGNETTTTASNVINGVTKSCGCLHKEVVMADITGERYGRLTAIKPTEERDNSSIKWLFQCDCGNEKIISVNNVRHGNTKSCGCLRKEMSKVPLNQTRIEKIRIDTTSPASNIK
jgi:hypothetical protein